MPEEKTNVMRILDQKKVPYTAHAYPYSGGPVDGPHVAALLGVEPERAFKTLVTRGAAGRHYVFVVPVMRELDLKAAAKAVGEKSIEMIRLAELQPLTLCHQGQYSDQRKCNQQHIQYSILQEYVKLIDYLTKLFSYYTDPILFGFRFLFPIQ